MTTSIRANVDGNVVNGKKAGNLVKAKLYFIEADQYDDAQPFPVKVGRERGNIPLKAGEYWHTVKTILDSVEQKWAGTVEDVAAKITNTTTFMLGGMSDEVFNLLENGIGKGFYVVFELCFPDQVVRYLIGNGCKPAKMTAFEGGAQKDYTGTTVTFEVSCGELVSTYVGNTTLQAPQAITNVATTFALTSNDTYQIAEGAAGTEIVDVSAITDADVNRVITIKGGGGAGPSKIVAGGGANAPFLLVNGAAWTGNAGSQISFRIMKDGAASYILVEVYGSRT
ncbi:MAG TPA: hypothetical protein VFG54_12230 [Prolixibacteraceae bacterium]|nr:hypothetical protein [Prolixibacteraceae bacterium]